MLKPDQEFFENIVSKLGVPIAILGAGGAMLLLVAAMIAMIMSAPGPAGTESGPPIYNHSTSR